ncbi:MAG: hypothetical protein HZB13_14715, partial [Acidobacteria bacterium]|nr:hypothetical protein [Acidobacteriota bacterium]
MFELIFVLTCLVLVIGIAACLLSLFRGRMDQARRRLRLPAAVAGAYLLILVLSSLVIPRQVFAIGEARCLDDWCITVTSAKWNETGSGRRVVVGISLSNRGRGRPMGERGTVGYLIEASNRRHYPVPLPTDIPYAT